MHTRKAAAELDGLKEELRKHGLLKETLEQTEQSQQAAREGQREERARPARALRPMRVQGLAPIVAVQRWAKELRAWFGERLGHGQRVEGVGRDQTESTHPARQQTITPDLAQRQKDLLQRLRAVPSERQERGQSQSRGHGHSH